MYVCMYVQGKNCITFIIKFYTKPDDNLCVGPKHVA